MVEIVGTSAANNGRSCKEHNVCGSVLALDQVVCFRKVQVLLDGKEESSIAVYWVTEGVDRCRIGFLRKFAVKHWQHYEGRLGQIVDIYNEDDESRQKRFKVKKNHGCVVAALISSPL